MLSTIEMDGTSVGNIGGWIAKGVVEKRLHHATMLRWIDMLERRLLHLKRELREDREYDTDARGVSWVEVDIPWSEQDDMHRLRARVYLDQSGAEDSDITDAILVTMDHDGNEIDYMHPDYRAVGSTRDHWRDRVRVAAYEIAIARGDGCDGCGEMLWDCCCDSLRQQVQTEVQP